MSDAARSAPHRHARAGAVAHYAPRQDDDGWTDLPPAPAHLDADDFEGYLAYLDSLPPEEDVRMPVKKPHAAATGYAHAALANRFPDAEVAADLMTYYRPPGRPPSARPEKMAPDVLVAFNVPPLPERPRYDVNVLGPPDFVLEVLSRGSWQNDVGSKLDLYERMGVREYLLFDPTGERFAGQDLFGYALSRRRSGRRRLRTTTLANGEFGVVCEALGLCAYFRATGPAGRPPLILRWHDPATGEDIPDFDESRAEAAAAASRAESAEARAESAEARAESAEARAESAKARAESAEAQATAERLRSEELERRLQDLLARRSPAERP